MCVKLIAEADIRHTFVEVSDSVDIFDITELESSLLVMASVFIATTFELVTNCSNI